MLNNTNKSLIYCCPMFARFCPILSLLMEIAEPRICLSCVESIKYITEIVRRYITDIVESDCHIKIHYRVCRIY